MKIRISAGGREVEIETSDTNVTPETISALAMEVWRKVDRPRPQLGFEGSEPASPVDVTPWVVTP